MCYTQQHFIVWNFDFTIHVQDNGNKKKLSLMFSRHINIYITVKLLNNSKRKRGVVSKFRTDDILTQSSIFSQRNIEPVLGI